MSNRLRNLIGFIVFVLTFSAVIAAGGVHYSFIGEHLPERINVTTADGKQTQQAKKPKYTFYDELRERKSELRVERDLTAATAGDETADKKYLVQIGAYKRMSDAERAKKKAEKLGYPVNIVKRGSNLLIQAGPFYGKKTTNTARNKLARNKFQTLIKLVKE